MSWQRKQWLAALTQISNEAYDLAFHTSQAISVARAAWREALRRNCWQSRGYYVSVYQEARRKFAQDASSIAVRRWMEDHPVPQSTEW